MMDNPTPNKHHSVSMQERLKLVQDLSVRLVKERMALSLTANQFAEAEATLMKELDGLKELQKYSSLTAMDTMSEAEWRMFFEKYFVKGWVDPQPKPPLAITSARHVESARALEDKHKESDLGLD